MLRTFGKMLGTTLTVLCLVSTLAVVAQEKKEEGMEMICTSSDGKGTCKSGEMNGIDVVVVGPGIKIGEKMLCHHKEYVNHCVPAPTKK
jgi:hypothetical protein